MMAMRDQMQRMRKLYPGFQVTFDGGWLVVWEGNLRPIAKTYRVQVALTLKDWLGDMSIDAPFPQVWLIEPKLVIACELAPDQLVPHIYPNTSDLTRSGLCLFDPAKREWTRDMAIADTTLPWTIDWLTSYEGWLATGEWTGGGRDHVRSSV